MELFDSMFIEGFLKHFHLISLTLEESDRHKPVQLDAEELEGSCNGQCSLCTTPIAIVFGFPWPHNFS